MDKVELSLRDEYKKIRSRERDGGMPGLEKYGLARARHILISFADPSMTPMPPWNLTPPMSVVADQSRPTCVQGGIQWK
jgi:hypothetical protein